MKISFLITYYNQEAYVRQSMDSVLAIEKPEEWEILVGDDGSSDKTREIVNEYIQQDPEHIRMYVMPRKEGEKYDPVLRASASRLNLLEHCSGDCFCVLDGDDFYTDTAFALEAIEVLEKDKNVALAAFGYREYTDGVFGPFHGLKTPDRTIVAKRDYLRNCYIHAGACVHRNGRNGERLEKLKKTGYFDDNNIVINTLNDGEMYYIAKPVYAYRQTSGSTYNRMDLVEKGMLNVQGMDVDLKLMNSLWRKDLISRYAGPLITVWVNRGRLREILGDAKYNKYLEGCRRIGDSIGEILLTWKTADEKNRKEIRQLVREAERDNPVRTLYARLNMLRRGMRK